MADVLPDPTQFAGRVTGRVLRYNRSSGYGFIRVDGAPPDAPDVFLHASSLPADVKSAIEEDVYLTFTVGAGSRGPKAMNVELVPPVEVVAASSQLPDQVTELEFGAEFGAVLERFVRDRGARTQVLERLCAAARQHRWVVE
jgi:cold shock CspA family protein